jgi:hypothetical protein
VARLVAAILGGTPLVDDVRELTDLIGGRPTGSPANLRAVEWAVARFADMGVPARKEPFRMPGLWLERSAGAVIRGEGVEFRARAAAMPFSTPTPASGTVAPLVDLGFGTEAEFRIVNDKLRGAWALVETRELTDIDGLFREYAEAVGIEQRAFAYGAAGVVYVGSRPGSLLYRHNASRGSANRHPMLVLEREAGLRALRLLRAGRSLTLTALLDLDTGPAYDSNNVIGEIRGAVDPDEIVLIGAHLDSWDLGTGALDNAANVALILDVARQIQRLGLRPLRTIRFALWNGEEQGLFGSYGYTMAHARELDGHVMTTSIDIGTGRINGFFTGGRPEVAEAVARALQPVAGLGPFTQVDVPIVGTDNFDFMMEGVANLVANQDPANYGPNYHARSDEFTRVDPAQLRLNAAIIGAMTLQFAETPVTWRRQTRAEVEELVRRTDLAQQMKSFAVWGDWVSGVRGRRPQ